MILIVCCSFIEEDVKVIWLISWTRTWGDDFDIEVVNTFRKLSKVVALDTEL